MSTDERTAAIARAIEEAQDLRDHLTALISQLSLKPTRRNTDDTMEILRGIHASTPYVEYRTVTALRTGGATWRQIAEAYEMTPQAAQQRWTPSAWTAEQVPDVS